MRNLYLFFAALLLLIPGMRNTALAVQLTGIYTINPGATATTTNFQNIRSAVRVQLHVLMEALPTQVRWV
jgi:hypothetical protein